MAFGGQKRNNAPMTETAAGTAGPATVTLADIMSREVPLIEPQRTLAEAAAMMVEHGAGALVVDRGGGAYGILSDRDMTRAAMGGGSAVRVADQHTPDIIQAAPDWSLQRAAETMARGGFRHLLVVEEGRAAGMVSIRDLLRALVLGPGAGGAAGPAADAELAAGEAGKLLYSYRRTAKQHQVAAHCRCELDWLDVLTGQLEERPNLTAAELRNLWSSRGECPRLAEPGGAD